MRAYLTAPGTPEGRVLILILIIAALIIKGIFKKFFPNVTYLKEVVITSVILLAVIIIYILVAS